MNIYKKGKVLKTNQAFEKILNLKTNNIFKKSLSSFIHQKYHESLEKILAEIQKGNYFEKKEKNSSRVLSNSENFLARAIERQSRPERIR